MLDASTTAQSSAHGLLTLLHDEHQRMDWMLSQYLQQVGIGLEAQERKRLIQRIDRHLRALMVIKETVLYPLVESKLSHSTMLALKCDHHTICECLVAMTREEPDTLAMDIHMEELALHVRDHIKVEECRLFPLARALDSADLGQRCAKRREQLLRHNPA